MTEQAKVPAIRFAGFTDPWEQRKLGELVVIERGGSPRPIDEYITDDTNGLNWIKIGDAPSLGRYISKTSEKIKPEGLSKTRQVHPGDLILSNSMSFGRPYIMAIEGCIHDGWLLIRDEPKSFDPMYLCHMLGTPKMLNQYRMLASGSTVNNLNKELVSNASILMPCKSEQKVIGQFFNHLDDLITLHQRKYDKLVVFKKSMLEKMFPKDGESVPEIRFAGFTDPWEQRKLGDIASFSKGSGYSKADIRESGIPLFLYGRMYTQYETRVDSVDTFAAPRPGTLYSKGTEIVVPASGESAEDIARASAITREGIALGGDLNVVYPQRMVTPLFLAYGLSHGSSQKLLAQKAQGKTVVHIHASDLKGLGIAFPDVTEQQAIGTFFSSLDDLITLHQRKLELLRNIKKTLLDKMFV